jgi:aspartyl-tRNA(Asn)/glutamyl-tRNA(Gln) amidotransferase subunit C
MIDKETVLKIAQLSKLELSEKEVDLFSKQLPQIIGFVEKLEELETENILPFYELIDIKAPLRKDEVKKGLSREEALKNALQAENGFFVVPRVVKPE